MSYRVTVRFKDCHEQEFEVDYVNADGKTIKLYRNDLWTIRLPIQRIASVELVHVEKSVNDDYGLGYLDPSAKLLHETEAALSGEWEVLQEDDGSC